MPCCAHLIALIFRNRTIACISPSGMASRILPPERYVTLAEAILPRPFALRNLKTQPCRPVVPPLVASQMPNTRLWRSLCVFQLSYIFSPMVCLRLAENTIAILWPASWTFLSRRLAKDGVSPRFVIARWNISTARRQLMIVRC